MRLDRHLQLNVYESVRRPLRRGWWSRWELRVCTPHNSGFEWRTTIAGGWTKTDILTAYAEFTFGDETEVSKRAHQLAYAEVDRLADLPAKAEA